MPSGAKALLAWVVNVRAEARTLQKVLTNAAARGYTPSLQCHSSPPFVVAHIQLLDEAVARARGLGATDMEIHDTVLIAAAFCMYKQEVPCPHCSA